MTSSIYLENVDRYTLVDDEWYDYLNQWKWYCSNSGYVARNYQGETKRVTLYLHKIILPTDNKHVTDHINGNTLDNRKENLREATKANNSRNSSLGKRNKSGYKGVCFDVQNNKWIAQITYNRKVIKLGRFKDVNVAAKAYNDAAIKYFGEFAKINPI